MTSRSRPLGALLTVLAVLVAALAVVVGAPPGAVPQAEAATRVAKDACRRIDPNLVNGACLRYRTGRGTAYTWIGSYRAPDGRVFFCIDFLYDSRLPRRAPTVSTQRIVNQLGHRVGHREIAALNYVVSTWAGGGSTGSDDRDAAIALIVREVMDDGTRRGGAVVYPGDLDVGERVRAPIGGLSGAILGLARQMWDQASDYYGPYRLRLTSERRGPIALGRSRTYRLSVESAAGRPVPDVRVGLACTGPVRCPEQLVTTRLPRRLTVTPHQRGRFRILATASGPAADGLLYRDRSWHPHGGDTARNAGRQRGWIAQQSHTRASVAARARIVKARPAILTQTSDQQVTPGAEIHDVVTVTGLPEGYAAPVTATLYGPFGAQPGPGDCTSATRAGQVFFTVDGNGTTTTPTLTVDEVGYFTWVEDLPGDDRTHPVTTACGLVEETTRVIAFTPQVRTVASTQRAYVGAAIRDTVVVSGIEESAVTVEWSLHGPRAPRSGSCAGLSWAEAPVVAHGSMSAAGDGTYVTPSTRLRAAGCYTYSERLPATPVTTEAVSPPGLAPETALVERRTPHVTTVVSDQHALVGERISDTVALSGLGSEDRVTVRWWLHGPLAPRAGTSCDGLSWRDAPIADRGEMVAGGNGRFTTRSTLLQVAGCYTYSERLPSTASTEPASTVPGIPVETALVTKPVTPYVPEIPSGPAEEGRTRIGATAFLRAGSADADATVPTTRATPRYLHRRYRAPETRARARQVMGGSLRIDRIGLRAGVDTIGLDQGAMAIPNDTRRLGWLATTAAAGELLGSSVISGHVSDRHDRPGALWRLRDVRVGDSVRWTGADGDTHRFVVRRVARYPRSRGVPAELFRTTGPHLLHLVTCTSRRSSGSGFHYADNLVVTAAEVR